MNDADVIWLAGLLEGEGSFGVINFGNGSRGYGSAAISLNMKDRDVVERAAALMEATSIHEAKPKKAHWSTTYQFKITGKKAIRIMQLILPYMGKRRSEAIMDCIDHEAEKPQRGSVGERNAMAKLTPAQVRRIRKSPLPGHVLAQELNVSQAAISLVRNRKNWAHI